MKKLLIIFIVCSCLALGIPAKAQLLQAGDAAVTMSGSVWANNNPPAAQNYVLEIFHTKNTTAAPIGSGWVMTPGFYGTYSYKDPTWIRSKLGNIFGITIDNNRNIYVTATGFYGAQVAGISTGQIFKIDGMTGVVTPFKDLHSGGQNAACLGNIKYFNGFLYVSNLADGKIYAVDVTNPAANFPAFDPGGAPDTRKPHGLAIRNIGGSARLFYSLNEFNSSTTSIHSIGISGSSFTGTETLELNGFSLNANPVTDIAFSKDNMKMILAEKSTSSWNSTGAHTSRVLEFQYNGISWMNMNPNYSIGTIFGGKNTAGGISFSQILLSSNNVVKCDTTIWSTGDALILGGGQACYGIVGFRHTASAGTPTGVNIDFDNDMQTGDKWFLGDVEVCDTTAACVPCQCGEWGQYAFGISYPGQPQILMKPCGGSHSFNQGNVSGMLNANYSCNGDCDKTFSWQLMNVTTNTQVTSGTSMPINLGQFNNLACGSYKFIVTPKCGNHTCSPCEFIMNIVCDPPPCCPAQTEIAISTGDGSATYTASNNPNGWGTYAQSFTLNSNTPMSEIRIEVEHFEVNSPDPDCISCRNVAKTWGSLTAAAFNGNAFTKPVNTLPFNSSANSNGRELIYKPGYLVTINNGVVNIKVAMPNPLEIDCCVLTAKVCIKFTFKDANCRECTYIYCNDKIEIEKGAGGGGPNGVKVKNVNKTVLKSVL